jgi:peptide deformylase
MSVRPIVMLGDPRLRLKGKHVDSFGKYLHELLDDLAHTMRAAPGVGLAAPQLGEALQACVIEVEDHLYELVNPRIVRATGEDRDLEGCLSIPGYWPFRSSVLDIHVSFGSSLKSAIGADRSGSGCHQGRPA